MRTRILAVVCLSVLALTGCSGTTDDAPGAGTSSAPAAGDSAPAGDSAGGGSGVSATAVCDYLRGELPKLHAVGELGAMAQLAVGLANFFDQNGKVANGAEIDELTTKECPDVRTDALKTIGMGTFAEL